MALMERFEAWIAEQETAEGSKRQQVLLKGTGGSAPNRVLTSKEMESLSLKLAYDES